MENMSFYEMGRAVPAEAKKQFNNGSFQGTDINPMWRIKKLTEMFGPAGIGWYTEILTERCEEHADAVIAIVNLNLYIKVDGEWSKPIYGTGGNVIIRKEGAKVSDEGYKMAYTDALSVACKALGIGADVYFEKDKTKYTAEEPQEPAKSETKAQGKGKITPKQIEAISARYKGNMMTRLLNANGLEKLEDMTIEKASDLIQKIKEADEKKKARAQKEEIA